MAPTEAQKRASAKYQRENIASLACRVKKEQAESFKAYCAGQGKTSNAVLRDYVLDCIGEPDSAQEAAEATGEAVSQFVERAVVSEAERDKRSWRMGINPATGKKAGE